MKRALAFATPCLVALAAFVAACPHPTDGTPEIPVSPKAPGRIGMIPSRARRDNSQASANARAHAHPLAKGGELGGPNATGKPGDWVLENDEVVFVIDGLGGGGGFAESGGNLVDAADARTRKDELGQLFTYFGTFPRQAVYTAIEPHEEPDGTATILAKGHELYEPGIEVVTAYRLAGADRAVLLHTTLTNKTAEAQTGLGLGDAIQWGGAEKYAPGKGLGFHGASSGPFIGGIGRFVSYAITSTEGYLDAQSGNAWTDTEQKKNVSLAPGESVAYERVFLVGERADAASVLSELTRASGCAVGGLEIELVDAGGKPVTAATGSKVVLAGADGGEVMSLVAAKEGASFGGEVPPGNWFVMYAPSAGRRGDGQKIPVVVKKDEVTRAKVGVTDASRLTAGCDSPCRVTVEGIEGTPTPDFGPAHVAAAARNQLFAVAGHETVAIAPGKYRLTFSRGPEYDAATAEATLAPGASLVVERAVTRVVDTTGYVATDFHQHTILSADSPVGTADRVRSNVAEGVEVAVATEHNVVADLAPVVADLGLRRFLVAIPGDEITSDANKHPWGHANVFPLEPDASKPRAGAFAVLGRTPREVFAEARALGGTRLLQVNHPRSGTNGYFDQLGFDSKTGVGTAPGYDPVFDALEVWNGRNVEARAKVIDDFLALLRTSHPVTPIGDTDTHGIVGQEAGYPRTFVRVTKDDALDAWDGGRTDDLVRGVRERRDVVLTNGPFLEATANGAGIGGVARAKGGLVTVKVRVQSAPFVVPESVTVRLAAGGRVASPEVVKLSPKKNARGGLDAEASFTLRVTSDDAFVVIASGTKPMRPMLTGDDKEIVPWAMSGAIWIDADGDGKALGR